MTFAPWRRARLSYVESVPRDQRPWAVVLLTLLGLWALFCSPLAGDGVPYDRDILRTDWPVRVYIGEALREGRLPQWYPFEGLGLPFIGNAEGLFRPFSLLYALPLLTLDLIKVEMALCLMLGLGGFLALAHRMKLSAAAASVGAVAYVFSGYSLSVLNNLPYLYPYHLVPWVLWAAHGALTSSRRWAWVSACAVLWSQVVLGGDPLAAIFSGLALVALVAAEGAWRRAGPLVAAVPLTAGLCLAWVLPAWSLFGESVRLGWTPDGATMALRAQRLPELLLGGMWADPDREFALKQMLDGGLPWSQSLFLGATLFFLAGLGVVLRVRRAVAWAICAVIALWLATGSAGGLHTLARTVFPLLGLFRYPEKFVALATLCVSLGAAIGLDALVGVRRPGWARALLPVGGVLVLAAGAALLSTRWHGAELTRAWGLGALSTAGFCGVAVGLMWASARRSALVLFVPVLVFAELYLAAGGRPYLLPRDAVVGTPRFCRAASAAGAARGQLRVLTSVQHFPLYRGPSDALSWVTATLNLLEPDNSALCGIEGLGVPNLSGASRRWGRVLDTLQSGRVAHLYNAGLGVVDADSPAAREGTLLDSGGRFVLMRAPLAPRPRAYDARARWVADEAAALGALERLPEGEVVLEGQGALVTGNAPGRVSILRYEAELVELEVDLPEPRAVVLNDLYAPGWTAEVDGVATSIYRANVVVRGVVVPAGHHRLRFTFEAPDLELGLSLAGLTLVMCLGLVLGELRRRPRSDVIRGAVERKPSG